MTFSIRSMKTRKASIIPEPAEEVCHVRPGEGRSTAGGAYSGVITIYLALIFVCVSALLLALVESARMAGLKYHLKVASNSALESLFSEYNNELWDRYRIAAYEYKSEEDAAGSIAGYMQPYLSVKSWMRMDSVSASVTATEDLVQGEGEYFEKEILSYMNYGMAESLFDIEVSGDVDTLQKKLKESEAMEQITGDYAEKTAEAAGVEKALDDIEESLELQQLLKDSAVSALRHCSGDSFDRIAQDLLREMEHLTGTSDKGGLIGAYEDASRQFEADMADFDAAHAGQYADLSDEGRSIIADVKSDYDSYSADEKGRRIETSDIYEVTLKNMDMVEDARAAADMIEELEQEMAEEAAAAAEEASDDPDFSADPADYYTVLTDLWYDLADAFGSVDIRSLSSSHGIADKESESSLENLSGILNGDILELVIPAGREISTASFNMKEDTWEEGRSLPSPGVAEKAVIAEYMGRYFKEFTDEHTGPAAYEMEYICAGRDNDRDDLADAVKEIFVIREGLNYLHIMMDGEKRSAARTLAQAIVAGTSGGTLGALVPVVECLIIGVWAGAESVADCRALLRGEKVALYKSKDQWKTDLDSIVQWGTGGSLADSGHGDENGLEYESYLKFLILLLDDGKRNSRAMDIIELNLSVNDPDFMISRCLYGMNIEVTAECTHIFTSLPVAADEMKNLEHGFSIRTRAGKEY